MESFDLSDFKGQSCNLSFSHCTVKGASRYSKPLDRPRGLPYDVRVRQLDGHRID